MAEDDQECRPPTVADAVAETLTLYDVYICGQCRLIVGRHERHDCQATHLCKEV